MAKGAPAIATKALRTQVSVKCSCRFRIINLQVYYCCTSYVFLHGRSSRWQRRHLRKAFGGKVFKQVCRGYAWNNACYNGNQSSMKLLKSQLPGMMGMCRAGKSNVWDQRAYGVGPGRQADISVHSSVSLYELLCMWFGMFSLIFIAVVSFAYCRETGASRHFKTPERARP